MTTTISDTFRDPTGAGVGGVVVRAALIAASEVLTGGGAIIREAETTTASNGTWSLTLTPISQLAVSGGAYYLITADGHRWTIDVPDSGTHALAAVQVEPGPLPETGLTTTSGIPLSTIAAKGDLLVGSAADTVTRLAVGTNNYVLTADSAAPSGVKWAAGGGGGGAVSSVFGRTGAVVAQANDYAVADINGLTTALAGKQAADSDLAAIAGLTPASNDVMQYKAGAWTNRTPAQLAADLNTLIQLAGTSQVTGLVAALAGKQDADSDLTTIAGLTATTDNIIMAVGSAWASRTPAQVKTALAIALADVVGLVAALAGKQDADSDLTTIAGLTATTDNMIQSVAGAWASRTPAQVKAALAIAQADVSGLVAALAGKQDADSDLTTIAGLTATTDNMIQSVAGAWASRTPAQVKTALAIAQSDVSGLVAALAALAPLASPALTGTATAQSLTLSKRLLNTPVALTDASTIAVDASLGNDFTVTLGGNRTLGNPSNSVNGQMIRFAVRQDGTGSRTLTLDTSYRLGTDIASVTLSTAAGKTDYIGCRYNSTDSKWDVIAFVKGY